MSNILIQSIAGIQIYFPLSPKDYNCQISVYGDECVS